MASFSKLSAAKRSSHPSGGDEHISSVFDVLYTVDNIKMSDSLNSLDTECQPTWIYRGLKRRDKSVFILPKAISQSCRMSLVQKPSVSLAHRAKSKSSPCVTANGTSASKAFQMATRSWSSGSGSRNERSNRRNIAGSRS